MNRGNVVIAAEKGSFAGKPRPWVVVQNALFLDNASSVTLCTIAGAGDRARFRVPIAPTADNGLQKPSLILADKLVTVRVESIDKIVGSIDDDTLAQLDDALRYWLDL